MTSLFISFKSRDSVSCKTMEFKGKVTVYSVVGCPFCARAKSLLAELGVPYVDINLDKRPDLRTELAERTGLRTVPQIFFNEKHIGGCEELKQLQTEGKLDELLRHVAETSPGPDTPNDDFNDTSPVEGDITVDCIPDDMSSLAVEIRMDSGLVGTHMYHLKTYKDTLVGKDLVQWLVAQKSMTVDEAVQTGKELLRRHFIHHVSHDRDFEDAHYFYRFLGDDKSKALNGKLTHQCAIRPANEIAEYLRRFILALYDEHLAPNGLAVDYVGIGRNPKFEEYVKATGELKRVDVSSLTKEQKIAFFVNIYNALVIHAFVVRGPPTNMWARLKFFGQTSYVIGGLAYSLNDMENGVLRSNRKPVAAFRRPFSSSDMRRHIALKECDPRVHFALVCGAKSCPPIKTYSAEHIYEELDLAMHSFLEGTGCEIDVDRREVHLSRILTWYKVDFGNSNEEVALWVVNHMPDGEKKRKLQGLLQGGHCKIKYMSYNWELNSS